MMADPVGRYKEYVAGLWEITRDLEEMEKVEKLAMDIATYGHGRIYVQNIWLFYQADYNLHRWLGKK
jgi:hypothetical protein